MQGYLFGRAMPNAEFVAWLALRDDGEPVFALQAPERVASAAVGGPAWPRRRLYRITESLGRTIGAMPAPARA